MKKKFFFLFSFLLVVFIFCWQPFWGFVLSYTAKQYTKNRFGVPLKNKGVSKQGDFWVFESPSIERGDVRLAADRFEVKFDWNLFGGELSILTRVKGSKIDIKKQAADLTDFFSDLIPQKFPYQILKINSACEIEHGRTSWVSDCKKREFATFNLLASGNRQHQEIGLAIWLDQAVDDKNAFTLQMVKNARQCSEIRFAFQQVECGKIAGIIEAAGYPLKGWEFNSGIINGHLEVVLPELEAPYAIGKATVQDLVFAHDEKNITGEIGEAVLDLHLEHVKGQIPALDGKVEFVKGTSLSFHKKHQTFWKINDLSGGVYFLPERRVMIDAKGECSHELRAFNLKLEGEAQLIDKKKAALEIVARFISNGSNEAAARFIAKQLGPQHHEAELFVEHIGPDEFAFVQEALARCAQDWEVFRIENGEMNASGTVSMIGWQLTGLTIHQMDIDHLRFDVIQHDITASIGRAHGDFFINLLNEDPLKTINADFTIHSGELIAASLAGNRCCLNDIETEFSIRKGVFQKSELKGEFLGLKGTIGVDWTAEEKEIHFDFFGSSERLAPVIPLNFRSHFLQNFSGNPLLIHACMLFQEDKLAVLGEISLASQLIAFGFDLEKSSEKLWKSWPADHLATSYWENVGLEVMQAVLPPIVSPTVLFESNWMKAESGIAGVVLRNGWFSAKQVDLERFVSPILFPHHQMQLFGRGNFKGEFDQHIIAVEYDAENIALENHFISIKVDQIGKSSEGVAAHFFDVKRGTHFGSISLNNALYIEKNSGLQFMPTRTKIFLEGKKMHLAQIETECMGIQMAGSIDIDFGEPNDDIFDLEIHVKQLIGGVEDAQKLLSRFNPDLPFLQFPLEGNLELNEKGAFFKLSFIPGDFSFEASAKACLKEGSLLMSENSLSGLSNLRLQFGYDHASRSFEISNLQADLQKEGILTGYSLYGDHLKIEDLQEGKSSFDFWIGDSSRDLIRFVGKTQKEQEADQNSVIAVHIDPELTHAGNIYPSNFQLYLEDWLAVKEFKLGMQVRLDSLLNELLSVRQLGLEFVLGKYAKEIRSAENVSGILDLQLSYDGSSEQFGYSLLGEQVSWNQFSADAVQFRGFQKDQHWIVENLQWDEKVLQGEFLPVKEGWKVKQFHFQNGSIISVFLNGSLHPDRKMLEGRVEQIEIDLAQMSGTPEIELFTNSNDPHGILKGSGNLYFDWGAGSLPWKVEAILDIALEDWDIRGIHFENAKNVSCHFVSNRGMTMRKLQTKILDPDFKNSWAQIGIEKIQYDFSSGEILFDELSFQVPAHHLPNFANQLQISFPDFVNSSVFDTIRNCKLEGELKGVLQYEMSPPYNAMRLFLEDGEYHYLNAAHSVHDFEMNYDPYEFSVVSGYQLAGRDFWFYARSSSPTLAYGELVLTDLPPKSAYTQKPEEAIFIDWENHFETGLTIKRVEGAFQGLNIQLEKDPAEPPAKDAFYLIGEVGFHGQYAKNFFPSLMAEMFENWKVGDGYKLQGKWRFLKSRSESYGDKLHFVGTFKGDRFQLHGYQFDRASACLEYTPKAIRINDFMLQDPSGIVKSDRIDIVKTNFDTWAFAMPLMTVQNFRPSLLQEENQPRPSIRKPLVIQELTLKSIQGNLSDSRTFIGHGSLHFTNRSKKILQNTIFQVPSEILSRIGLDLSVLTPVSGSVSYKIQDGKFHLIRFKDVYSDGKLSKFYLAPSQDSTVDFEGGLKHSGKNETI